MPATARRPERAVQHTRTGEPPAQIMRDGKPLAFRQASFIPASWDPEARTIDLVVVSVGGAAGVRDNWWTGERWVEELSLDPAHVRLGRLNSGAPYLIDHHASVHDQIGSTLDGSARFVDGVGLVVTMRLAGRAEVRGICDDIAAGIIRNCSVGYLTHEENVIRASKEAGALDRRVAVDWEPHEVSAVAVGFDAGSQTRNHGGATTPRQEPAMPRRTKPEARAVDAAAAQKLADDATALAAAAAEVAASAQDEGEGEGEEMPMEGEQAAEPAAERAKPVAPVAPVVVAEDPAVRTAGIFATLRALNMPVERAEALITGGQKLAEVREMLINERAAKAAEAAPRSASGVQFGKDHKEQVREAMTNAVMHRANPRANKLTDGGREFVQKRMVDLARECLIAEGVECRSWPAHKVFSYAMRAQSTSDFPLILADVTNKALLAAWPEAPAAYEAFCARTSSSDLKTRYPTLFSGAATLTKVAQGADYPVNTLTESRESYSVSKFGQMLVITLEALINDDLGAFNRIPQALVNAAIRARNAEVFGLINTNGNMADGVALFAAGHSNLVAAGAAPSATSFNATGKLIRLQTGLKSEKLDLAPRIVVAPAALEHDIEQLFSPNYLPTSASGVLAGYQSGLQRVYSPFLDDTSATAFYMFADPNESPVIEYATLDGMDGLSVEEEDGFENDTKKFKIRDFFGAGVVDHRGAAKNPGV